MNFLIQLKPNAIPQLRNGIFVRKLSFTSAIEISQRNANTRFFAILDWKRVNNLLKKTDIYRYSCLNEAKLSSVYRIALLTKKKKN